MSSSASSVRCYPGVEFFVTGVVAERSRHVTQQNAHLDGRGLTEERDVSDRRCGEQHHGKSDVIQPEEVAGAPREDHAHHGCGDLLGPSRERPVHRGVHDQQCGPGRQERLWKSENVGSQDPGDHGSGYGLHHLDDVGPEDRVMRPLTCPGPNPGTLLGNLQYNNSLSPVMLCPVPASGKHRLPAPDQTTSRVSLSGLLR